MSVKASGGSPVVHPYKFQTLPTAVISQAEQQDRSLKQSEVNVLANFFSSGAKRLEIVATLAQNADTIVAAGGDRIFWGGNSMEYLERPQEKINLPGYVKPVTFAEAALARANASTGRPTRVQSFQDPSSVDPPRAFNNPISRFLGSIQGMVTGSGEPLPGGFRTINISRYGPVRMKRSMRDLAWFLRYISYAIIAGDESILTANVRGLRAVMPEDITMATVVALKEMRGKSLSYFGGDEEAKNIVTQYFDTLIDEYQVEKPPAQLRQGISKDQQGLELPQSYVISA
ncbi:MAG: phycobilisome rod-core linker polypeptide, partial [Microcystaceae cyanobacterium]